jgi:hypothetical protein
LKRKKKWHRTKQRTKSEEGEWENEDEERELVEDEMKLWIEEFGLAVREEIRNSCLCFPPPQPKTPCSIPIEEFS